MIKRSALFTGNSAKPSDAQGTGSQILAEILPHPGQPGPQPTSECGSSVNVGCWTCSSMLTRQTKVGKEAMHQKPTHWSRTGETSSRKQAVAFQQEGPLTSLWMQTPRLNLHPRTTVSLLPSEDRTVNTKRGEALQSRVDPFSRCHCVPRSHPSSHPRDVREPVSAWWAAPPGTTQMIPTVQTGTSTASGPQPVTQSGREHL